MRAQQENRPPFYALPRRQLLLILGAVAVAVVFGVGILLLGAAILGHGEAKAQPPLSRFIPPRQQLAALEIQSVPLVVFHDEVITDGHIVIKGGPGHAAPAIPARAVIYEGDTARVWVAGSDGSLALRDIKLGRSNGEQLEVTRGLSSGEKIVTSGAFLIDRAAGE